MQNMYYIGLDVHKRTISYCGKDIVGRVFAEGKIPATRSDLDRWMTAELREALSQSPPEARAVLDALDEDPATAVDGGDGSHRLYRLDLRSSEAPRSRPEGRSSADAAGDRGSEEEERSHRRQQDLRLPAL